MSREDLLDRLRSTRQLSVSLSRPLKAEDFRVQSMPDVSPPWWNLGHTTWFFAKNILEPHGRYDAADARYEYVLNSYYEMHGSRVPRAERGLQTRPTTEEIFAFRERTDTRLEALIREVGKAEWPELAFLVEAGIQHEQQHQELFVTEIKHILGTNAPELREPYLDGNRADPEGARFPRSNDAPLTELAFEGTLDEFGNREGGWCFDNEMPVHRAWLEPFALSSRLVTNGEYLEFIADGGYDDPLLWLANGWQCVSERGWTRPLYWEGENGAWHQWSLRGMRSVDPDEPVGHVSFYEADAFARWKGLQDESWTGCRLPTEREWEHAARALGFDASRGNFLEDGLLCPRPADSSPGDLAQAAGDLWEWTTSHYEPYPGYEPFGGALTEYNGKFMDNQRVLRGGSCATPRSHIRPSYRNFWPGDTRFQFTGIRLARSLGRRT